MTQFDARILELLGPKTEADSAAGKAKPKKAAPAVASSAAAAAAEEEASGAGEFSNIEEMYAGRDLKEARNSQVLRVTFTHF